MNYQNLETEISPETAKQITKELYVYTRLMRKAQIQYFATRLNTDLQSAKVYESLLDTKLSMIFKILKAKDSTFCEVCEKQLNEIWNSRQIKQVDLFK